MGEIKKKRFVVYVRCSTEDQSRGDYTTLDAQEDFCKSYLHSSQFEFVRTVRDDGHSAKNLARPGIRGILQEARLPESERTFDGVVFFKLDRLTRRMKDLYDLVDYFKDNNIEFISVAEKFDTSTPHGRAMLSLVGTFACLEREQLGERVKAAGIALTRQ
ncbi:MAG: recombinase family protein, partial [Geobacteraceae bacterium]|nr:recombinase family protein [Geobacteraceae bacterium]